MIRFAGAVLGLALAISAAGASPAPAHTHSGKSVAPVAQAAQSTPPTPLALGSSKANPVYVTTQCGHGCGYSEDRRSFVDKIWTDPVAAFTAVLAVFTAVLALSTIALWWVTRAMADTSKRALLDLERPIVYGGVSKPGLAVDASGLQRSQLELSIYNHGRTIARLRRIEWDVRAAPKGSIAPPIDPSKVGGRELPPGTVCVSGDPFGESENLFAKWDMNTVGKIAAGELSVWVVGFVRYDDVFKRHHISGFCQVFDPLGGRFVRRGSDVYNYERSERSTDIPPPSSKG